MKTQTIAKPHFSILATSFAGGPRPRNAASILAGLWFLVFFCSLFSPPLLDDADATHAQAARAIAQTGDLVTLKVDGVRYLEKAPLPYWLVAASFRIFGYNTFAAHLPQALAVALLMLVGHRWANQAFGARTGFYTALGVLTSVGVFLFTRILIPEVLLSLFLASALFAFLKSLGRVAVPPTTEPLLGELGERPAVAWYAGPLFYPYAMWACVALAVLTKGLVALVFFFATTIAYLTLTGEWTRWRRLRPLTGLLLFLAIAAPWHILAGLRNTGGARGHGFWWFYFWNEHVLRFLGQRTPRDYNKMPGWAYWAMHLVWLLPWSLFLPLGVAALWRRFRHQTKTLTGFVPNLRGWRGFLYFSVAVFFTLQIRNWLKLDVWTYFAAYLAFFSVVELVRRRLKAGLVASPFHRIDPQQKTILLLSLFAAFVLLFFSLSTNQEYYTFPAYLPILLLTAATITRAEQTYVFDPSARRWVTFAHAALTVIGAIVALVLVWALWVSRTRPYVADIGNLLARRGVGDYTLSMSHAFDLTVDAFAGLRLPAALAALAFALGPALAWLLRAQRRHIAATTAVAFTSAAFLMAAHIAFARFGPMLSSEAFAARLLALEAQGRIAPTTRVLLYGDQAYGSSISFYLGRQVGLVDGRSTSMWFGSTFPDAPPVFETSADLLQTWESGERKVLFIPQEERDTVDRLLRGRTEIVLYEASGKLMVTDRLLDKPAKPHKGAH
jgi:hypothetical protein